MKKILLTLLLIGCSGLTCADDGIYAINDVCRIFGCFSGDTGGYPITINNSGSYQLTSNLVSTSPTVNVIEINADNVTLDLNGFSIIGPRTCTGNNATLVCSSAGMTANGINATTSSNGIVVKNGMTQGFDAGVSIKSTRGGNAVTNIRSSNNEFGISVFNGTITDSIANLNLEYGFANGLFGAVFIKDSYAYGNKTGSAFAFTCSNVFFANNGTDANCQKYSNGSTCGNGLAACP